MSPSATHWITSPSHGRRRRNDRTPTRRSALADGKDDRGPQDGRGHRVHEVVAQQSIGVRLLQPHPPVGGVALIGFVAHRPSLHRLGRGDAELVEDGGRDVGEGHEPRPTGRRRSEQAGVDTGAPQAGHGERPVACRRHRRDHEHGITREVDVSEERPEQLVAPVERLAPEPGGAVGGGERSGAIGAHEV